MHSYGWKKCTHTLEKSAQVQLEGKRKIVGTHKFYNLDVIISVDYRVRSNRGIWYEQNINNRFEQDIFYHLLYDFPCLKEIDMKKIEKPKFYIRTVLSCKTIMSNTFYILFWKQNICMYIWYVWIENICELPVFNNFCVHVLCLKIYS